MEITHVPSHPFIVTLDGFVVIGEEDMSFLATAEQAEFILEADYRYATLEYAE